MNAADIAVDLFRHRTLLFRRTGNLGVHVVDGADLAADTGQGSLRLAGLVYRGARQLPTAFHNLGRLAGARLKVSNHFLNFPGGILGPGCQGTHFVGYHGESPAMGSGPGRLDCSIQGQQVGLFGDGVDHLDDLLDVRAVLRHPLYGLGCLLQGLGQLSDGSSRFLHHAIATFYFGIGFLGSRCSAGSEAGHFVHRGRHLVHGRGHLFRFAGLQTDLLAVVVRGVFKFRRRTG